MTVSPLESSIREESARAIAAIREKEALEIRQIDEAYTADIDSFRKQAETETETRLQQELSRLSNRAILERRKFELLSMESFINTMVNEVAKEIRNNPQYRQFLLKAVRDAAEKISTGIEVRLNPEDLIWEKEILTTIKTAGGNRNVIIKGDPGVRWGGCLVFDKEGGRIFNHTLERIYFRKSPLIRQKIIKIMTEHANREKGLFPTAAEPAGKESLS